MHMCMVALHAGHTPAYLPVDKKSYAREWRMGDEGNVWGGKKEGGGRGLNQRYEDG